MKRIMILVFAFLNMMGLLGCWQKRGLMNDDAPFVSLEGSTAIQTEQPPSAVQTTETTTVETEPSQTTQNTFAETEAAELTQTTDPSQTQAATVPETVIPTENTTPAINEEEIPVPTLWIANCEEYITLRDAPGGSAILTIPKGAAMELLSWNYTSARVRYSGTEGYVLSNYIKPAGDGFFAQNLQIVTPTNMYAYEKMMADLAKLKDKYPNEATVSNIGYSEMGREIPVLCIGNLDAQYHVLVQGAIHGREHMTAWLVMAMAEYWLEHDIQSHGDVCYHMIPMSNPDGVSISQTQVLNDTQQLIYQDDIRQGYTHMDQAAYAATWKANGEGVDINRNFPSGWEYETARSGASSERYRGLAPFSSAEAAALRDYTLKYPFDATVSYHSTGSVIYYEYGSREPANSQSESLAWAVNQVTGYPLIGSAGVDGAGYKDWAIDGMGIPSITVETGVDSTPLAMRELYSIFVRNFEALPAIARWLQQ